MTKTIVIGSGFGGIASALRMRARGDEVILVERLSEIGGRAQVFEKNGFRHDAGPTVITAPFLFDELFELFGEKREDHIEFRPLDPWYRFYFHTGEQFDYAASLEQTCENIEAFSPEDARGYRKLLKISKDIFDVGFTKLADKPFTRFGAMMAQVPALLKLRSYLTVSSLVARYIKHPLIRQAFSIHPLLVGGNPFSTTSIYALIHYLERKWGVYFAMGGTGALVAELRKLMERHGIEILCNTDVQTITTSGNKVTGIITSSGTEITADRIICNGDPPVIYNELLPQKGRAMKKAVPEKLTKYSMGLFVLFFGTKTSYPDIAHHTIWMGPRFEGLLHDIFDKKILADDFLSIYTDQQPLTPALRLKGVIAFMCYAPCPICKGILIGTTQALSCVTALSKR